MLDDLAEFLRAVRFDHPARLWLVGWPLALGLAVALLRRRRAAVPGRAGLARWAGRVVFALGAALVAIGGAGPRWGAGPADGVAVGRDWVVVLDLSRSMLADDTTGPARWQSGVDGVSDWVETLRGRGGHRVALVVFAANPVTLTPLTTDLDHVSYLLAGLDGALPPQGVRPTDASRSGTRIGAALKLAVSLHEPRFAGAQDILLISDGDDPLDDREWAGGVTAARAANVAVHAVGVGDPDRATRLPVPDPRGPVTSKLEVETLRAIATEGRGELLIAGRERPDVAAFTRNLERGTRLLDDDARPQPRDRSRGFLLVGLVCLLAAWWRAG